MRWLCFLVLGWGFLGCESNTQVEEKKLEDTKPAAEAAQKPSEVDLKTLEDKAGYMFGLTFGKRLKNQAVKVNLNATYLAIDDMFAGREPQLDDAEVRKIRFELQKMQQDKQKKRTEELAVKNAAEGKEFLAKNKLKPGVITLPSGLQYKVLREGTGEKPKAKDKVKVHYRGTLIDGTVFDSSYKRNQPLVFRVTGVIKGWVEALQLMPVGSKWELYIPSGLAYGKRGPGGKIGPNSTLIFEVELLGIQ